MLFIRRNIPGVRVEQQCEGWREEGTGPVHTLSAGLHGHMGQKFITYMLLCWVTFTAFLLEVNNSGGGRRNVSNSVEGFHIQ